MSHTLPSSYKYIHNHGSYLCTKGSSFVYIAVHNMLHSVNSSLTILDWFMTVHDCCLDQFISNCIVRLSLWQPWLLYNYPHQPQVGSRDVGQYYLLYCLQKYQILLLSANPIVLDNQNTHVCQTASSVCGMCHILSLIIPYSPLCLSRPLGSTIQCMCVYY